MLLVVSEHKLKRNEIQIVKKIALKVPIAAN